MRSPEKNPLDLNNLPDDFSIRDGKQVVFEEGSSSSGCRKKKSGAKDGKDECGKVYECRFCSLKFCKSQALGGHMNRHRQERETETLNRARQLVFNSENLAAQGAHLGCHPMAPGSYHPAVGNIGDPYRSSTLYPPRLFSASSSTLLPPPALPPPPPPPPQHHHQPYLYSSASRLPSYNPSSQQPINDYYIGHVLNNQNINYNPENSTNYTCIGAPVGHGSQEDQGLNWGRSYAAQQRNFDPSPSINRFQDGF